MSSRDHIWSLLIVTATTVLIWAVVASATRGQSWLYEVPVTFTGAGVGNWDFEPSGTKIDIRIEGSALAIQDAEKAVRQGGGVRLEIPTADRETSVNLLERLRDYEPLTKEGVSIVTVEPDTIQVLVDELRQYDAVVAAPSELPGIQPDGQPTVSPSTATVQLATLARERYPDELVVEAIVDPVQLQGREPGVLQAVPAQLRLRPADPLGPPEMAPVTPETAQVSFVIASRIRAVKLDNVRVHLAGPHEDFQEYSIKIDTESLRNVTISADSDLADDIEAGTAKVVALLHLSNRDKEGPITEKAITCFVVLVEESEGDPARGIQVEGRVDDGVNPPVIGLVIERVVKKNGE